MRPLFVYTAARLGLFLVTLGVLYLLGATGFLLFALAIVISGLAGYVLLSNQRDALSGVLHRLRRNP